MNRRTKLTVPALAVSAALALAACSGGTSDNDDSGTTEPAADTTESAAEEFTLDGDVRMIVPFSAGGGSDLAGRAIAAGLEEVTGATVTVENIVGGSGAVGYSELLAADGDPSQLLASETSLMTLPMVQDVPFTYESFTPIMKVGEDFNVVIVADDAPYETCMDVVDAAKETLLNVAVSGATGPDAVAWGLIEDQFGVEFERVTFESTAEVIAALLGGHIDVAMSSPGEVLGQLESGDVRGVCALAPERYTYDELADIPTGAEQGVDVTFAQWRGFIAAGGLSDEARQFWIDKAKEYEQTDAYAKYIESNMLQPQVAYGDDFVNYLGDYKANLERVLGSE